MRKRILYLLIPFIIIAFSACTAKEQMPAKILPKDSPINIIFATDIHYLCPSLVEDNADFAEYMQSSDGKLTHYSKEIVSAFIRDIKQKSPNFLILGGDLTFNGEKASHKELSLMLAEIKDAGIPVLVIPGNHDINRPFAYKYTKDGSEKTDAVTSDEFWKLYKGLGAENAVSFDEASLSYLYNLSEDFQVLMLDTSRYNNGVFEGGKLEDSTLAWVEDTLKTAKDNGITVMTITHHNLLPHNPLFPYGFTIENYEQIVSLLEKYDVSLNLGGHIHMQHIAKSESESGLYDIANNALSVYPNYYGELNISPDKTITYQTSKVDVSAWAKAGNSSDENLLSFEEYSLNYMNKSTASKLEYLLFETAVKEELHPRMIKYAQKTNADYFAGLPSASSFDDEDYLLWDKNCPGEFFTKYLHSILLDKHKNSTHMSISVKKK